MVKKTKEAVKQSIRESAKQTASDTYAKEVDAANEGAASGLEIPRFLRRAKTKAIPEAILEQRENEQKEAVQPVPATDMSILSMYLNEGGHRRFLWVNEGNRVAHLLYVPTLEYVQVPIAEVQRQKAIGRAKVEAVGAGMATVIRAKAEQWDRLQKRFSRIVVNEALAKLGASPLPTIAYADDAIPRAEDALGEKAIARTPREGGKKDVIAALLLRPEGCTTADILGVTGWPSVSVPAQAKVAGLTLRKEKVAGQPTRYWGTKG